jgi:hypothetical protein
VREELVQPRRRTLEEHHAADVHVVARRLLGEERGVDGREAIEVLLRHGRRIAP